MAWTNFASLGTGPGTTPELDANFLILSGLVNIPCTCSGTNTLTLTQSTTTGTIAGYANYMTLNAVAAASNTGSVTANFNTFGALNVYKDLSSGPTLLSGGEIIIGCEYTLIYDSVLNSSAGGFHLRNSSANLNGQAIVAQSINATVATITTVNMTNLLGTSASITGAIIPTATLGVVPATVTLSGMQMGSITNALRWIQSTVASFSVTSGNAMVPGGECQATISFTGCTVGDNVVLGYPVAPSASVQYNAYVGAAGSIIFRAHNAAVAATITVSLFTLRFTNLGWQS